MIMISMVAASQTEAPRVPEVKTAANGMARNHRNSGPPTAVWRLDHGNSSEMRILTTRILKGGACRREIGRRENGV